MNLSSKKALKGSVKVNKTPSQKFTRRVLRELEDSDTFFYTKDGRVMRSLWELIAYLNECNKDSFEHHVNLDKNDFARWIGHVIMDRELAEELDWCLSSETMRNKIIGRINFLVMNTRPTRRPSLEASRILEEAEAPEEVFITSNGRVLRNLWELEEFLRNADEETFSNHVSDEKNDFAEWVWEIIQDFELAKILAECEKRQEMAKHVKKRLVKLERLAGPRIYPRRDGIEYVRCIRSR